MLLEKQIKNINTKISRLRASVRAQFKLVKSTPVSLSGTVGERGNNKIHDVAMVQAMLSLKKIRGSTPYYVGKVTGKYDQATAAALMAFRLDNGDKGAQRPLAARGPLTTKLAHGQNLAAAEGTAVVYFFKPMGGQGQIGGPAVRRLSQRGRSDLAKFMAAFSKETGIVFNVAANNASGNKYALVGEFVPQNLRIVTGGTVPIRTVNAVINLRQHGRSLHDLLSEIVKDRLANHLGINDPVNLQLQRSLKGRLSGIVRTDLDGIEEMFQGILDIGRRQNAQFAVKMLSHYLSASARPIRITREDALSYGVVRNAVATNIERFMTRTFRVPETSNKGYKAIRRLLANPSEQETFTDDWQVAVTLEISWKNPIDGIRGHARLAAGVLSDVLRDSGAGQPTAYEQLINFRAGAGSSTITSKGEFNLNWHDGVIHVSGSITHTWADEFDFNKGREFYEEGKRLQDVRPPCAATFKWHAKWSDQVEGLLRINRTLWPTADEGAQWLSFEAGTHVALRGMRT